MIKPPIFSKVIGASIVALSLAMAPLTLPTLAQNQNSAESNNPTFDTTPLQETENDFNNFGWLGLIGLIGLANLFRKRRPHRHSDEHSSGYHDPSAAHPSSYTDPNAVGRTYNDNDPDVTNRPS